MKVENFDKAAKNDDAPVNFGLWNLRILSIFPQLKEKTLNQFQSFFLMIQKRQFYLKVLQFLWITHPQEYSCWLKQHNCIHRVTAVSPTRGVMSNNKVGMFRRSYDTDQQFHFYNTSSMQQQGFLSEFLLNVTKGTFLALTL